MENKKDEAKKNKIEIYCKNPKCFNHYLARHKINKKDEAGRLSFEKKSDRNFRIFNNDGEKLGDVQRIRVGRFMQWCLTNVPSKDIYLSPGCQDEIREFCRKLKGEELKNATNK